MLDENELLTSMVHAGASVLFARQVARFLAAVPRDQYLFWLQGFNAVLGQAERPVLPPVERSPHEPMGLY